MTTAPTETPTPGEVASSRAAFHYPPWANPLYPLMHPVRTYEKTIKEPFDWTMKHGAITAGILGLIGAGLVATSVITARLKGEKLYEGAIEEFDVTYAEGRHSDFFWIPWTGERKNILIARKERSTLTFEDIHGESSIEWKLDQAPTYNTDTLERITYDGSDGTYVFSSEVGRPGRPTIEKTKSLDLLAKGTFQYNSLRSFVRQEIRNKFLENISQAEEFMNLGPTPPSSLIGPSDTP